VESEITVPADHRVRGDCSSGSRRNGAVGGLLGTAVGLGVCL